MIAITIELTQAAVTERLPGPARLRLARQRSQGRLGLQTVRLGSVQRIAAKLRGRFSR